MTSRIRVLHLEDSPRDAQLLHDRLSGAALATDITLVTGKEGFEAAVRGAAFDLILSDYNIPGYSGIDAVKFAREHQPETPVIVVSGTVGEEEAVRCLHVGATDYLIKMRLERLVPAVQRAIQDAAERRRRREAEAQLREVEARFRELAERSQQGFWFLELNPLRLVYVSPAVEEIWGRPAREFYQDPDLWFKTILPEDAGRAVQEWQAALQSHGSVFELQFRVARPDGSVRWVIDRGNVTHDGRGAPARASGVVTDVTESRRLEAQFRQAQKMEAVGRLAGGVAHDFNNLLTVIFGEAEFALRGLSPDDPTRVSVEEIRRAGERAAGLTRQLLLFSRQEMAEVTVFDVNVLIGEMGQMLRRLIGEDIALTIQAAKDPALVRMDRGQLVQVLMNLAVNARDAMPDGGMLRIEVTEVELDEEYANQRSGVRPGAYLLLAVSDSGLGMSDEIKAQLFEPFFTTKEAGKGTGLGLAVCEGIVKQAGGHIAVYSEAGLGTTMKVYLPADRTGAPARDVRTAKERLDGKETILLVEDDDAVRRLATRILEASGYRVIQAESGETALDILERDTRPVQLLLTDVVLHGMNGKVLAQRVAAMRPGIKVLYSSGYTGDVTLRLNLLEDGVALLQKPYTADTLRRKLREVLDG